LGFSWSSLARLGEARAAEPDPSYLPYLLQRARALELAQSKTWLRLGHWQSGVVGAPRSRADGSDFFLSPRGKADPAAELEATLQAFFAPEPATPTDLPTAATDDAYRGAVEPRFVHPQCRFPARLLYLFNQLEVDTRRLPVRDCPRLAYFWRRLQPQSVALVFSAFHLQAPSSAFGHTFLRFDKGAGPTLQLLDQGVDFSADAGTTNPLLYAVLGLSGGFQGRYHALPFYYKVREYADYESRDLWQYPLQLKPEQLAMLVAHLWELGWTHFDYWYLSENCSYQLLAALEVAVPHARLLERLAWPVLPTETLKVAREAGLLGAPEYRPSLRSQFRQRLAGLDNGERWLVSDLASDPSTAVAHLPVERRVRVLDAAVELIDIRFAEEVLLDRDTPATRRRQRLLEQRSQLRVPSETLHVATPLVEQPDRGHGARRMSVGGGTVAGQAGYVSLEGRLALHDLADPPQGYPELGMLEFLAVRARLQGPRWTPRLERFDLVHAGSIVPLDRFQPRPSWEFRAGAIGRPDLCPTCVAAVAGFGGGMAVGTDTGRVALWLMGQTELQAGPRMAMGPVPNLGLGVGPHAGLRVRWTERLVSVLQGDVLAWPLQPQLWQARGDARLRWQLAGRWALAADARWDGQQWLAGGELGAYF
jgi:hypothetical protein